MDNFGQGLEKPLGHHNTLRTAHAAHGCGRWYNSNNLHLKKRVATGMHLH